MYIKKLTNKDLRKKLEEDNVPKICEYCSITEEEFKSIWVSTYGGARDKMEVEHKDGNKNNNDMGNITWSCPICNCAKSDKLTYKEMIKAGKVINKIWKKRKG